jgi:pimeloyl-ACP methyl ester carboxylesterase
MTELRKAYPESEPYLTGRLRVSELHELYYEECGNPHGKPVVLLHGGPGGGSTPFMRRLHDPKAYRIILFDQRGSGRSTPHAELRENTTWDLVADIERLREHLGIEKWQVLGGSWGSTLALAYAELCPNRVSELVLRGVFMLRRDELLWFYQSGAHWLFPDAWEAFVASIPEAERGDMISAYYKRLTSIIRCSLKPRVLGVSGKAGRSHCWMIPCAWRNSVKMILLWPLRGSNVTISFIAAFSTLMISFCAMSIKSRIFPVRSSMVDTMSAHRSKTHGICTKSGREPISASSPMRDMPAASRAFWMQSLKSPTGFGENGIDKNTRIAYFKACFLNGTMKKATGMSGIGSSISRPQL